MAVTADQETLPLDTQAVLLLCGTFTQKETTKPLTLAEYNALASWLSQVGRRPADLLSTDGLLPPDDPKLPDANRVRGLLGRGVQMATALERWEAMGLWVVSRVEDRYPKSLRPKLRSLAAPLLFGAGDLSRLDRGGLAIVGSRDADEVALTFARRVAERCAAAEVQVISGGARGVDQAALASALEAGGGAVAVPADRLDRVATSRDAKEPLRRGFLTLVTPYEPEAAFTVGRAMGRNKYIFALADYALVVRFTLGEGGTWAGAVEQLRRNEAGPTRVPVFVRVEHNSDDGWRTLRSGGGLPFPEEEFWRANVIELLNRSAASLHEAVQGPPLPGVAAASNAPDGAATAAEDPSQQVKPETPRQGEPPPPEAVALPPGSLPTTSAAETCYHRCLPLLLQQLQQETPTRELKNIAKRLELQKVQLDKWLKRAIDEKKVRATKKGRLVMYVDASLGEEPTLFDRGGDAA